MSTNFEYDDGRSPYDAWQSGQRIQNWFRFVRRWWRFGLILFVLFFILPLLFRMNSYRNDFKHFQSRFVGIQRKVTLYSQNGGVIREWTTDSVIEDRGGSIYFIAEGKSVSVSGTFVVEEL